MSIRALEIAHQAFGDSMRDIFSRLASELDRSRGEVAELLALVVARDREIAKLRDEVKQLRHEENGR